MMTILIFAVASLGIVISQKKTIVVKKHIPLPPPNLIFKVAFMRKTLSLQ